VGGSGVRLGWRNTVSRRDDLRGLLELRQGLGQGLHRKGQPAQVGFQLHQRGLQLAMG
jgi:hypothetical protein